MLLSMQVLIYCVVCYCELVHCFKFPTDIRDFYYESKRKLFGNDHNNNKPASTDRIIGQGELTSEINNKYSLPSKMCSRSNTNKQIPMSLLREINGVSSLNDFMDRYVEGSTDASDSVSLASRFGESDERSTSTMLSHAACMPEPTTVPLEIDGLDAYTIIHPSCVRVNRCGGCCDAVSDCQPTSTGKDMVSVVAKVFKYNHDTNKFAFVRNEIVPLETHTECHCGCKLKAEHCRSYQKYHVEDCACQCNNTDEQEKCQYDEKKHWNSQTCTCKCNEEDECATGFYFNHDTCECTDEAFTTRRPLSLQGHESADEIERIKQDRRKLIITPGVN